MYIDDLYILDREHTFIVHIGGHLDHTEAEVDWSVVKMIVGLQDKLSSQLYILIDQHSIEVFILETKRDKDRDLKTSAQS